MKQTRSFEPHLTIKQFRLAPGKEWKIEPRSWWFLQVTAGVGYWLHTRNSFDLDTGSVLVLSGQSRGVLRASQLGEMQVQFFEVRPERLTGVVSFGEQRLLETLAAQDHLSTRHFPSKSLLSEKFRALSDFKNHANRNFTWRWQLLDLFAQALGEHLASPDALEDNPTDAKARLVKMLEELPCGELLDLDFSDMVRQMGCTPRHLSRVFREVVGMSFREKQAQVRLGRAQELLATTQSKVVEVALESGYQSLSLFNLMFKRRFGVSPAQWREQARESKRGKQRRTELRSLGA